MRQIALDLHRAREACADRKADGPLHCRCGERSSLEAEKQGVTVGVCHQNRFNAPIQPAAPCPWRTAAFGKLVNGTARILWNRTMPYYQQAPWRGTWAQDGGTLMNQCIHDIDLLQWCLGGEPDTIMAMTGNYLRDIEAEDFGSILIRFKNGTRSALLRVPPARTRRTWRRPSPFRARPARSVIGGLAVNRVQTWNFAAPAAAGRGGGEAGRHGSEGRVRQRSQRAVCRLYRRCPHGPQAPGQRRGGHEGHEDHPCGLQEPEDRVACQSSTVCPSPRWTWSRSDVKIG